MAVIYYELINKGLWTIERVPSYWKADVQKLLDADKETQTV